ncbi:SH3 domain-binding protein 2-like isoform X2 [Patiria miniata]|uniref:Uncharacterized protein n=1 Tax=Patiria miniata TaxID=46514 RepID=A0A914B593_PATMI|nr:SH3 domain-binding protein 2-like isoform X2 [Patiria miniata]
MDPPHWQSGSGDSLRSVVSASSLPMMDEDNNYMQCLSQQQLENISVTDILKENYEHNGFLYKRAQEKVTDQLTELISPSLLSKWQLRYVILYNEFVLYYKNEKCARPKGVFSLRGYNRVLRAEDMTSANQQWAFKIIGMRSDDRTWYFGAASEREMKLWMAFFKVMMERAIHGKARDKSLRILKELKYRETKFVEGGEPASPTTAAAFEPGIYEDIEEPLEEEDYLPPRPNASMTRQLPVPPRNESLERRSPVHKSLLPVPPPRPEPARRASSDYIQPPEADVQQISEFRHQYGSQNKVAERTAPRLPSRPPALPPQPPSSNNQRQGPEGNSFRKKPFIETPLEGVDVKGIRAALKPVVPLKPRINPKPPTPVKPEMPLKPKPAERTVATKEAQYRHSAVREPVMPPQRDLLPETCLFGSSDKRTAEGLLYNFRMDGMYLMRLSGQCGGDAGKVLMVYNGSLHQCKHYKIFGNGISNFSLNSQPIFANMHEMLEYYSDNPLPNTTLRLSTPYPGVDDNL